MQLLKSILFLTVSSLGFMPALRAQNPYAKLDSSHLVYTLIEDGDTLFWAMLPEVTITGEAPPHLKRRIRQWTRLRNAVYVTYPYARIAAGVLKDVDAHLGQIHDKKARKDYLKEKEDELKEKFGSKIEDLSIYQGKVLIKLIYRETGHNCYNIIKQLKGGFSARFWQTIAFVFGSNLKTPYDKQENADIESIVQEIESNPYYYNAYYFQYKRNYN